MQNAFHLFIIRFLRFRPLEILLCLGQKKLRYLKDMQILYEVDAKHQMTSKYLVACKYGIILHLLQQVMWTSKTLVFFKRTNQDFKIPSL